jgi:hypothetical protein
MWRTKVLLELESIGLLDGQNKRRRFDSEILFIKKLSLISPRLLLIPKHL